MIIDAHRHYWDPTRLTYDWLAEAPETLRQAFLPEDLVDGDETCMLVQAAPSEDETRYLYELGRNTPGVLGVVGWVDMAADDAEARLDRLIADGDGLLRGIRPMVQDIPDPHWLLSPGLDRAFEHLRDRGLVFDALVDGRHLRPLLERLGRHTGLRCVIDHAAKPDIDSGNFAEWASAIARLAQMPDVSCKFSGLPTQTASGADAVALEPYVAHLFNVFGSSRLIWGSDWPVVTTATSYATWKACAQAFVRRHAPGSEDAIFGGNAIAVYSLDVRKVP